MLINENLLYFIWQQKLHGSEAMTTINGEKFEIINHGTRNLSSGPDFLNGRIKINDVVWAGHIEFHVLTSDWVRHKHEVDPAYGNVILHVVYEHDKVINDIPVLELKKRIDPSLLQKYTDLMDATQWISCEQSLPFVNKDKFALWADGIAIERLEAKCLALKSSYAFQSQDWHQLLYEQLGKYFGASNNKEIFQDLTQRLPLQLLLKNLHQPLTIEAMIFGVAGFLEDEIEDDYYHKLKQEYDFQKSKYNLVSLQKHEWRKYGMYQAGSPALRLGQFAGFILHQPTLFDKLTDTHHPCDIKTLLKTSYHSYWQEHFDFGKKAHKKNALHLSDDFMERLIINAVVPVLFSYGKAIGSEELIDTAIDHLSKCKSEQNHIIKKWKSYGFDITSALESQAMIELKTNYCDAKLCLYCPIGRELLG